jgi:hypothetical protein
MSDGGWTVGFFVAAMILGALAASFLIAKRPMNAKPLGLRTIPPETEAALDMRALLQLQAREAETRAAAQREADRLWKFLDAFAWRLMEKWAGLTYDEARKHALNCLDAYDMSFPDSQHDWSEAGAREMAEIYAADNGESFGANE